MDVVTRPEEEEEELGEQQQQLQYQDEGEEEGEGEEGEEGEEEGEDEEEQDEDLKYSEKQDKGMVWELTMYIYSVARNRRVRPSYDCTLFVRILHEGQQTRASSTFCFCLSTRPKYTTVAKILLPWTNTSDEGKWVGVNQVGQMLAVEYQFSKPQAVTFWAKGDEDGVDKLDSIEFELLEDAQRVEHEILKVRSLKKGKAYTRPDCFVKFEIATSSECLQPIDAHASEAKKTPELPWWSGPWKRSDR